MIYQLPGASDQRSYPLGRWLLQTAIVRILYNQMESCIMVYIQHSTF